MTRALAAAWVFSGAFLGPAFADEPSIDRLSCIVEEAYDSGFTDKVAPDWGAYPESFTLSVSTCAAVKAGAVKFDRPEACEAYSADRLVLQTTIPGFEISWDPGIPTERLVHFGGQRTTRPGAMFEREAIDPDGFHVRTSLSLSPILGFHFMARHVKEEIYINGWRTLKGYCTRVEN